MVSDNVKDLRSLGIKRYLYTFHSEPVIGLNPFRKINARKHSQSSFYQ